MGQVMGAALPPINLTHIPNPPPDPYPSAVSLNRLSLMNKELIFEGVAASPGVVMGKAHLFNIEEATVAPRTIREEEVPAEVARFEDALIATRKELMEIRKELAQCLDWD